MGNGDGKEVRDDAKLKGPIEFVISIDVDVEWRDGHDGGTRFDHLIVRQRQVAEHVGIPPLSVAHGHSEILKRHYIF